MNRMSKIKDPASVASLSDSYLWRATNWDAYCLSSGNSNNLLCISYSNADLGNRPWGVFAPNLKFPNAGRGLDNVGSFHLGKSVLSFLDGRVEAMSAMELEKFYPYSKTGVLGPFAFNYD
jgi:hypothetical protein